MKMQVFVIHGGNAFTTHEEYIDYLKGYVLDINRLRGKWDWKSNLQNDLGEEYDVFLPEMPSKRNAKYAEWKIWFDKFFAYMEDGAVLVGHSLGGCFLAKYLAEETMPKQISATFLVAAPYLEGDFAPPQDLGKLAQQGGKIFLYQSKDDGVVDFGELAKYQAALPAATVRVLDGSGHINQDHFPEIVADIKAL